MIGLFTADKLLYNTGKRWVMLQKEIMSLADYVELSKKIDFSNVDKIDLIKNENNYLVEVSFKLPVDFSIEELKRSYGLKQDYLKSVDSLGIKNYTG